MEPRFLVYILNAVYTRRVGIICQASLIILYTKAERTVREECVKSIERDARMLLWGTHYSPRSQCPDTLQRRLIPKETVQRGCIDHTLYTRLILSPLSISDTSKGDHQSPIAVAPAAAAAPE